MNTRKHQVKNLIATMIISSIPINSAFSGSNLTNIEIKIKGPEHLIYNYKQDACETWDIPDASARAFRGADGSIRMFQTHFKNRILQGPTINSLKHSCHITYSGSENMDPSKYDDRSWIASTYTSDGIKIYAILHNEFQANRWKSLCPSEKYMECWYNSLVLAVSLDGGQSFKRADPPLIAALPFKAKDTVGHHAGYFGPTNIVKIDDYYYFMALVVGPEPQLSGNCIFRSKDISDSQSWLMWRNGSFETRPADPYAGPVEVDKHLCDPVDKASLPWPVTGIVKHEASHTWIATMIGERRDENGVKKTGIYYATSRDLLTWDRPARLVEAPTIGNFNCNGEKPIFYPALIDPNSTSRNFETVGDNAELTFTRVNPQGCSLGPDRDLVSVPVTIRLRADK